jgi:predicted CXXCH cytochrome family protein
MSRSLLAFLFDGVPTDVQDSQPSLETKSDTITGVSVPDAPGDTIRDDTFYHYPYKENYCSSCHDEKSKSEMIMPEPDLCYSCHDDYSSIYNVVHGPAAGGYCTSCHHPHMSADKKLLLRKGNDLCLFCHDSRMVAKNQAHDEAVEMNCTDCHNPHGGNDRNMIR